MLGEARFIPAKAQESSDGDCIEYESDGDTILKKNLVLKYLGQIRKNLTNIIKKH